MVKVNRTYKLSKKTIDNIDFLQKYLSKKTGINLSKTAVLEYLINDYFQKNIVKKP